MKDLLYTFFFGYAAFKWRRLFRTLILIPSITGLILGFIAGPFFAYAEVNNYGIITNNDEEMYISSTAAKKYRKRFRKNYLEKIHHDTYISENYMPLIVGKRIFR